MTPTKEPLFDILSYKYHDDGTADVEINFSDEFIELYKKATKKKRATKKGLANFFETILVDIDRQQLSISNKDHSKLANNLIVRESPPHPNPNQQFEC